MGGDVDVGVVGVGEVLEATGRGEVLAVQAPGRGSRTGQVKSLPAPYTRYSQTSAP